MVRFDICSTAAFGLLSAALVQAQEAEDAFWDVLVLGGGSTGTFSAIRLRQQGLNVIVVEQNDRLGGHVNTYIDPATKVSYDYGVQIFTNTTLVEDYFAYFDVPRVRANITADQASRLSIDIQTGAVLNPSTLLSQNVSALATGVLGYRAQIQRHPDIINNWDLSYPIDPDLLMPFGDFLAKYGLQGAAYPAYSVGSGVGNILAQPTIYVMKYFTTIQLDAIVQSGFIRNGLSNNQELYNRALAELGETAFLSSHVHTVTRDETGVEVHMYTPSGPKRIKARKLLISIPPKLENLAPILDLDANEQAIFGKFNNSRYYNMMVKNTGFPANLSITNLDPEAALQIPAMPAIYTVNAVPTIPGVHSVYYGSLEPLTESQVKAAVTADLDRVRESLGYPAPPGGLVFLELKDHGFFGLHVPREELKGGFYRRLLALQGQKDTWYTGAAWFNQASGELWEYTEREVLPGLVKSLGLGKLKPFPKSGRGNNTDCAGSVKDLTYGGEEYTAPDIKALKRAVDGIKNFKWW